MIVETKPYSSNTALVIVMDSFSLDVVAEQRVTLCDPDYVVSEYPEYYDNYAGDMSTHFPTFGGMQKIA